MAKPGRPKKGSAELPEWFDIEQYRFGRTDGAAGWFQQLVARTLARKFPMDDANRTWGKQWQSLLQANPHMTIARLEELYPTKGTYWLGDREYNEREPHADFLISEMTIEGHSAHGIRPVTNGDIVNARKSLDFVLSGEALQQISNAEWQEPQKDWRKKRNEPFDGDNFGRRKYKKFVRVDLLLPEALLMKNFAEYVKRQKKILAETSSPFFKNQDFSVWYNSGVLPYLDLCAWEIETGQTFRWAAFVRALNDITDEPISSQDTCRKATKSLADKLMDSRTIRMLNFQAIKDKTEATKNAAS